MTLLNCFKTFYIINKRLGHETRSNMADFIIRKLCKMVDLYQKPGNLLPVMHLDLYSHSSCDLKISGTKKKIWIKNV